MHLLAAIPNAGKYLELSIEGDDYYPWQRDLFLGQPFAVKDGHVTVSDTPGWGVDVSPAWLNRVTYTEAAIKSFRPSAYGALYHKGGIP
jgi:L-alanine-DL-glutamate epimerase-like enolase superfamily enzyme